MGNEREQYIEQARDLLRDLEQVSAYTLLGLSRDANASEIHPAFARAFAIREKTGHSPQALARARDQLKDPQKRLILDTQALDRAGWLRELESLRNRYALFDFLDGLC